MPESVICVCPENRQSVRQADVLGVCCRAICMRFLVRTLSVTKNSSKNMLNKLSFDGILTGANGQKLDVDCIVSLPIISGAAASVTVNIPLAVKQHAELTNPCNLHGEAGSQKVEINELWYHRFPLGGTKRKLARDALDISHIGSLKVLDDRFKNNQASVVFHLSPVEFFRHHTASAMTSYSSTPEQTVELFKISAAGLGEIVFMKQWAVHHIEDGITSAHIHSGFYAHVVCQNDDLKNINVMVETFREVLTVLSILFRQGIGLLAWEKRSNTDNETLWEAPLQPNLAPYMEQEKNKFLAFPNEFEKCAEELVSRYLATSKQAKEVIKHLSVSIAPHFLVPEKSRFLSMFSALELAIDLAKLTVSEKEKIGESNAELVAHLQRMRIVIEDESSAFTAKLLERVDGFIKVVKRHNPSFSVKLTAFFKEYPAALFFANDLWPIEGSDRKLGLKEIRNGLTHGVHGKIDSQTLAVASWHFSIFIERLIFVMVGAEVPKGIRSDSYLLTRDEWYCRSYWTPLQRNMP